MARITKKEILEWYNDKHGADTDPYVLVNDVADQAAQTKGNRNGCQDEHFLGPKRMKGKPSDRFNVVKRVTAYVKQPGAAKRSIEWWMDKFDHDARYTLYRYQHSNVSPLMVQRYKDDIKGAPGNNGRVRCAQMCSILAFMDSWSIPATRREIVLKFGSKTTTIAHMLKIASWLLGTERNYKPDQVKSKRVTNLNKQHIRTRILETQDNKVVQNILICK